MVELLVALAISSILLLGISTIFLDARKTDKLGVSLSRIQETGRFAINFLATDVRMAGYLGCIDLSIVDEDDDAVNDVIQIATNPSYDLDLLGSLIRGFEVEDATWANGTEFDNQPIETNALIGSDVIAIRGSTVLRTPLTGAILNPSDPIPINNNTMGFQEEDIVIVADCENASMFRVSDAPGAGATTLTHTAALNSYVPPVGEPIIAPSLSATYGTNAQVMGFESVIYFVAATGRTNSRGDAINALYRLTDNLDVAGTFTTDELVEGVDNLQVLYGERLDTDNIHFVPADDLVSPDMRNVESIKLGLLISSAERVQEVDDNLSYELPGETIAPLGTAGATVTHAIDQRIRRDFSTTINLRNRL